MNAEDGVGTFVEEPDGLGGQGGASASPAADAKAESHETPVAEVAVASEAKVEASPAPQVHKGEAETEELLEEPPDDATVATEGPAGPTGEPEAAPPTPNGTAQNIAERTDPVPVGGDDTEEMLEADAPAGGDSGSGGDGGEEDENPPINLRVVVSDDHDDGGAAALQEPERHEGDAPPDDLFQPEKEDDQVGGMPPERVVASMGGGASAEGESDPVDEEIIDPEVLLEAAREGFGLGRRGPLSPGLGANTPVGVFRSGSSRGVVQTLIEPDGDSVPIPPSLSRMRGASRPKRGEGRDTSRFQPRRADIVGGEVRAVDPADVQSRGRRLAGLVAAKAIGHFLAPGVGRTSLVPVLMDFSEPDADINAAALNQIGDVREEPPIDRADRLDATGDPYVQVSKPPIQAGVFDSDTVFTEKPSRGTGASRVAGAAKPMASTPTSEEPIAPERPALDRVQAAVEQAVGGGDPSPVPVPVAPPRPEPRPSSGGAPGGGLPPVCRVSFGGGRSAPGTPVEAPAPAPSRAPVAPVVPERRKEERREAGKEGSKVGVLGLGAVAVIASVATVVVMSFAGYNPASSKGFTVTVDRRIIVLDYLDSEISAVEGRVGELDGVINGLTEKITADSPRSDVDKLEVVARERTQLRIVLEALRARRKLVGSVGDGR
jgi:hypothetical protein